MLTHHSIKKIAFIKNEMVLSVDGKIVQVPLGKFSKKLLKASSNERNNFEISPSGYGIHWPLLDENLSIDGLLGISHQRQSKKQAA
jgi:hypothetical protein